MTTITTAWPIRQLNQAIAIAHSMRTDMYCFDFSEDGVLTVSLNELRDETRDPEFIRATKHLPNYIALNQEGIADLARFLATIEA